jgi:NAD(P)H dehydrogenase (quinone)
MAKVAIIYYSSTGHVDRLARAIEEGALGAGAEVRRRHVEELAPDEAVAANPDWAAHREAIAGEPTASLDDLEWADADVFGTPTRFGNLSAQLKQFMDQAGGLWAEGKLSDKLTSGFTSAQNPTAASYQGARVARIADRLAG